MLSAMALRNEIEPAVAQRTLQAWLARRMPDATDVEVTGVEVPRSSGMSSETVLFDAGWREGGEPRTQGMVARVAPTSGGMFRSYDLAREARVMTAVVDTTPVPAPRVLFFEEADDDVLGAPFLVVDRRRGQVPADDPPYTAAGWVLDLGADEQARLYDNALATVAQVRDTDWRAHDLRLVGHPDGGADALGQQLEHWRDFFAWTAGDRENPTIEAAFEWVQSNRPAPDGELVLNWGDARLGNMMFAPDQRVTGVFDWEMATLGAPEIDLGWFVFLNRNHSEGLGAPLPHGFPSVDRTIDRYEQLTGREVRDFAFYEAFAGLRAAIMLMRVGLMMIDMGMLPADHPMPINNPANVLLASMLDLGPPAEGAAGWITGSR